MSVPIVTNVRCFAGYPLEAIGADIRAAISAKLPPGRAPQLLLRLECFLQITGQNLDLAEIGTDNADSILRGFVAALYSSRFQQTDRPWQAASLLAQAIGDACPPFPSTLNRNSWPTDFRRRISEFGDAALLQDRVTFWRGWTSQNLRGKVVTLQLWPVHIRFGAETTATLRDACDGWYRGGRSDAFPAINDFARFLGSYDAPLDFQSSRDVGKLFRKFFDYFFTSRVKLGTKLSSCACQWRDFAGFLTNHLLGHAWAEPLPALPTPRAKAVPGARTNIRATTDGTAEKVSLLTSIPLHLTDSEAKELLFARIKRDMDCIIRWARVEVSEARIRLNERSKSAERGIATAISTEQGVNNGVRHRLNRANPECIAHAAATLIERGFGSLSDAARLYPRPLSQTAWELALPTPPLLLAHATLLIRSHPQITVAFLEDLELYDVNGDDVGFVKGDAGWYLIGAKMRKGPEKARQQVLLNAETAQVVRDVIELTRPLREFLRSINDDKWRRLMLSTPSMGSMPVSWSGTKHAARHSDWLAKRLVSLAGMASDEAISLADRFTLKRVRASAGVLVYIETGSVERMARALGHDTWRPQLLDHYLPKPIQEFFVERWIRIFQTGIICEALKGSPCLLEASGLASMSELDAFLEAHALKIVPAHLQDPEEPRPNPEVATASVAFGIDVGILGILISLIGAVKTAEREPCGRAVYWARIGEHLINHLESQRDQPEFREMVVQASAHARPDLVQELVYG